MSDLPTVYVVDDDHAMLDLVKAMLAQEPLSIELFSSGHDFLKLETLNTTGCVLLDNQMPELTGLDVQDELLRRKSHLPVMFMSGASMYDDVVQAIKKGAMDFLQKPFTRDELKNQVDCAVKESKFRLLQYQEASRYQALLGHLTRREKEVYGLVVDGFTNKAISQELNISLGTVEFHRANIIRKLGVSSLADLVNIARGASKNIDSTVNSLG